MPPELSQSSIPVPQASSSASGRSRRFGLLRMQSFRRADLEGIPKSLVWSIVSVEPKLCPWARPAQHNIARSGSSTRLTAPSRSFRTLYGALGLLRGNSSSASRSNIAHPFREDSIPQPYVAPSPSQSSRTSVLGWRAPFLHSAHGEMATSMREDLGEGTTGPAPSAGLGGRGQGDSGSRSNPAASSSSHPLWLWPPDVAAADSFQAAVALPWATGPPRSMSLGHAIQLLEMPVQRSIPEGEQPVYGAQ